MAANIERKSKAAAGVRVLVCLSVVFFALTAVVDAAEKKEQAPEEDRFGEIFIHPRDRHYLPEKAPSRAVRQSEEKVLDADRGPMFKYEYQKGNTTIYRDVWEDPNLGGHRSSFGLRLKF